MFLSQILRYKGGAPIIVSENDTLAEAMRVMSEHGVGALIIPSAEGEPLGVISERDIVRLYVKGKRDFETLTAGECMTRSPVCCTPHETVDKAMQIMTNGRFRHLPVCEEGKLMGVISIGDVVKAKIAEAAEEAEALRAYIAS